ncbi:gonadotropin-releasing hormone receptor [Rhipicephalus microplus]|uniref:gonadotropin-releasing hormone receptor n=1 Tax=Rhipicephalus microplus TaxID=6941 RepID=UPI003F6BF10C
MALTTLPAVSLCAANATCLSVVEEMGANANSTTTNMLSDDGNWTVSVPAETAPQLTRAAVVRALVLVLIAGVSLFGNSATLLSIWFMSRARRSSLYLLLAHLSVADLMVTAWCVLAEAAWTVTVQWLGGDPLCKLFKYMQMFSLYLSTFILVVIGYDQLIALRYPMERARNRLRSKRLTLAAWMFSALLSLPQVSFVCCFFITSHIGRRVSSSAIRYLQLFSNRYLRC